MRGQIAFHRPLSGSYHHLGVEAPEFPGSFAPGQFLMLRPPVAADPLLARAFSIYWIGRGEGGAPLVEILYKVVGKGTQLIAELERGRAVEVLGPMGNGFTPPQAGPAVLVAGGIGVPPIAALARVLAMSHEPRAASHDGRTESREPRAEDRAASRGANVAPVEVFLGGKGSEDILCVDEFEAAGMHPRITTEDGSLGSRGLITDLLDPFLSSGRGLPPTIFACGPPGMLAAVARLAETHGVRCQTSVEANMACGFGACMGCAIEARGDGQGPAYKLVCKDGPVFDSRELVWR